MNDRRIFNHPIRKETTLEIFPNKLSISEFRNIICDNFAYFLLNMERLGGAPLENKHIEEWVEQYLAWLDIEEEK